MTENPAFPILSGEDMITLHTNRPMRTIVIKMLPNIVSVFLAMKFIRSGVINW